MQLDHAFRLTIYRLTMLELVDMDLRLDAAAADAACLFNSDMSTERSNS